MKKRSKRTAIIGPGNETRPRSQIQTTKAVNRNCNCYTDFLITLNLTVKKKFINTLNKHSIKIQTKKKNNYFKRKTFSESDLYWFI